MTACFANHPESVCGRCRWRTSAGRLAAILGVLHKRSAPRRGRLAAVRSMSPAGPSEPPGSNPGYSAASSVAHRNPVVNTTPVGAIASR